MAETQRATCNSCRFYADDSTCRKHPPVLVRTRKLLMTEEKGEHLAISYQHSPMFPAVIGWIDWCGEWTAKKTDVLPALLSNRALNLGEDDGFD